MKPALCLLTVLSLSACPGPGTGFDDHTVERITTVADYQRLAPSAHGRAAGKFVITGFNGSNEGIRYFDGAFYSLHDEWYWFRLLNGQSVPGFAESPVNGPRFKTIDEVYSWAKRQPPGTLPLDLTWIQQDGDNRLYSPRFYEESVGAPTRTYGVGSLIRFPDRDPSAPPHWLIQLEYTDLVSSEEVAAYFDRLRPTLPAEIGDRLRWVIRSPQQEATARAMIAGKLEYHDRVVHFSDLVAPGTVSVYGQGITAGRLLYVGDGGRQLSESTGGDILITERVPDWLPPASALITSDPQTPLAHVSLLARNRGIPNASLSGIHLNPGLRQAAVSRGYAVVVAQQAPDGASTLRILLITPEQFNNWRQKDAPPPTSVDPVSSDIPAVMDLTSIARKNPSARAIDRLRPILGGKSAGFLSLLATPGLTPPPTPVAISVGPYVEHLKPLRPTIEAAITDPAFFSSPRARWLVLEGTDDFSTMFPNPADHAFVESFIADQATTPLGKVVAAGGLRQMIEDRTVNGRTLQEITTTLSRTYADYALDAGLRFRSSSSVEDIEGFNGAGLYTSYTGYLNAKQLGPDFQDKTIERALRRAWASYWSFEAFQERSRENIDHLSGAMGLTVHARFDDELEQNNGVATFTFLRGGSGSDATLEINVQAGSVDVTNPDPTRNDLPEVLRLVRLNDELTVQRVSGSTIAPGGQVVTDAQAKELFAQTAAVADLWRRRENAALASTRQMQTLVLDFEFKTMAQGWPRLREGRPPYPPRLVIRQVRSLEPAIRSLPEEARSLPIPLDILRRSSRINAVTCGGAARFEVLTDPFRSPDMGYTKDPFVRQATSPGPDGPCTVRTLYESSDKYLESLASQPSALAIIDSSK